MGIADLHVSNLYVLQGSFINQPYLFNSNTIQLFDNQAFYWGIQVQKPDGRCFGIACCERYIVVSEYGKDGADEEIVLLKRKGKIDVRSTSVADFIRENILKQKSY